MEWWMDALLKGTLERSVRELINAKQALPSIHSFNKHLLSPIICQALASLGGFSSDSDLVLALQMLTGGWGIETSKWVGGLVVSAGMGGSHKK